MKPPKVFEEAQNRFLASLSRTERQQYAPCLSSDDLLQVIGRLDVIARKGPSGKRWLSVIKKFADGLEPYFKIIEIFISSNPEFAALFWGSLRLILKLASDYTSFFEKFIQMLSTLTDALPQYDEILKLCQDRGIESEDEANPYRMRMHIELVYQDIFKVLHIALGIFQKPDGREKNIAAVAGSLLWKPFDARFATILDQMAQHRRFTFDQLVIWHADESVKEIARAAAEREIRKAERQSEVEERRLAVAERRLMELEREQKRAFLQMRQWLAAPDFASQLEKALNLRITGTDLWFLDEAAYTHWKTRQSETVAMKGCFGSGHPGAGKTILAATVVDELRTEFSAPGRSSVYYYFFDHQYPASRQYSNAYRSIVAQLLWRGRTNSQLLDRFTFIADEKGLGQLTATELALFDLLHLCLDDDAVLVIDGIDECDDTDGFIESLLRVSNSLPKLRILLFSRVNVAALKLLVPAGQVFALPKAQISDDIRRFCLDELEHMFERQLLPPSCADQQEAFADRLCIASDGMFLWARLMTRCLRSPYLAKGRRLEMINQVNLPEGLEKMYERIVALIRASGPIPTTLASNVLTWLAFSVVPITTRQLRQAIAALGNAPQSSISDDISEFEDCIIMACAGLIEPSWAEPNAERPTGERALRFIHLSLQELIQGQSENIQAYERLISSQNLAENAWMSGSSLSGLAGGEPYPLRQTESIPSPFQYLVPRPAIAHLAMAMCCLRQLLYHTPAQPLSGTFSKAISEEYMNQHHCFASYAAVHLFGHLKRCLKMKNDVLLQSSSSTKDLVRAISTFLAKPRVLSAWLETFYTAKCQRKAAHYRHPPLHTICELIEYFSQLASGDQSKTLKDLLDTSRDFRRDVNHIVEVWDIQLETSPEIVWDEMTYYAKSRFFFSPESLKVSIQDPEPPNYPHLSPEPVARMSNTSSAGEIKGILSIWAPRNVHNRQALTRIRSLNRNKYTDIWPLCEGWVATYHVWKLESPDRPAAHVQIPLDPGTVLPPLLDYLEYPITDGLQFPLAISANALCFCILQTLYVVHPRESNKGANIFSVQLQEPKSPEPSFLWKASNCGGSPFSYNIHFSPDDHHVVLHESYADRAQGFAVFRYVHSVDTGVVVDKINTLTISSQVNEIVHLSFHPTRALLIFHAKFRLEGRRVEKAILIWRFRRPEQSLLRRKLPNYWGAQSITFSMCGSYVVIHPDFPANAEPVVIPCPEAEPEDEPDSRTLGFAGLSLDLEAVGAPEAGSLARAGDTDSQPTGLQRVTNRPMSTLESIDETGSNTHVSVSSTSTDISLARKIDSGVEITKVLTFPSSIKFSGAIHTAFPPRSHGDMFKVSVDMDRKRHYSLVERQPQPHSAVIERDPAFISAATTSLAPVEKALASQRHKRPGTDELDTGTEWVAFGITRSEVETLFLVETPTDTQQRRIAAPLDTEGDSMGKQVVSVSRAIPKGSGGQDMLDQPSRRPAQENCSNVVSGSPKVPNSGVTGFILSWIFRRNI
ncbi:hypothetical protein GQ53DRAFT_823881 [Thozetella sp. PMI_491]|nr:hypothetical protein GQ53DRAFT_823881 [Thozetella sp. PMI_491]